METAKSHNTPLTGSIEDSLDPLRIPEFKQRIDRSITPISDSIKHFADFVESQHAKEIAELKLTIDALVAEKRALLDLVKLLETDKANLRQQLSERTQELWNYIHCR